MTLAIAHARESPSQYRQPTRNIAVGIQTALGSRPLNRPRKCSGAMPITVKSVPLMRTVAPSTPGSSANRVRQRSWLRIATGSRPGTRSSSAEKKRPAAGSRRSRVKQFAVTTAPITLTGPVAVTTLIGEVEQCAASDSNARA